jgi:16S rRNA (adenine1518-N6/adenine1519-N6)-dimethyltransferase
MTVSETKHLLRKYRIVPNRLLGQNFMLEPSLFLKLCDYASLCKTDVVLDVGAGLGFLSHFLAAKCRMVLAVEKDPRVAAALREQLKDLINVMVYEGDVLKVPIPGFNKVISIPPYYLSSRLMTWLFDREFECAVMILQKEFARRLVAAVGSDAYGWLTVITYHCSAVDLLDLVHKSMFFPEPEVDSVIVRLAPRKAVPFEVYDKAFFRRMVRWLFTQRNKKLSNALLPFITNTIEIPDEAAERIVLSLRFHEERVRNLSPEAFGEIANAFV